MTPTLLAAPPARPHAPWCRSADHEGDGTDVCTSELVEVGGATAWLSRADSGARLILSGEAIIDGDQAAELLHRLAILTAATA